MLADEVEKAWEIPEDKISYAGEIEREQDRKRRGIKAVLLNDGKQRETCIGNDAKADQAGHDLENGTMDAEQEH